MEEDHKRTDRTGLNGCEAILKIAGGGGIWLYRQNSNAVIPFSIHRLD
jgi:hypothetical protein